MNKPLSKDELRAEALSRARNGTSFANYPAIVEGFIQKGIAPSDIEPRVNVFTYNAWLAKGRQVRKGEKGVKIFTWIVVGDEDEESGHKVMKATTVFHVSQTDPATPRNSYSPPKKPVRRWHGITLEDVRDPGEDAADRWNETHGDR